MINMTIHRHNKGFTIVETLVAIAVLMIAIAGPLTVATKGFTAALDARNQTIASGLAQELMEDFNNWKDNNPNSWNTLSCAGPGISSGCGMYVTTVQPGYTVPTNCSGLNGCSIYLDTTTSGLGYGYDATKLATSFDRWFYLTSVPDTNQRLLTVVVTWNTGSLNNQVQLQELLSNTNRNLPQ